MQAELLKIAKPIRFDTRQVRATLDGIMTETRIPIPKKIVGLMDTPRGEVDIKNGYPYIETDDGFVSVSSLCQYQSGDILYVRETWCRHTDINDNAFEEDLVPGIYYKADARGKWVNDKEIVKWRPSIHMPKEAARIFLRVTEARVERVQDITEDGARDEGVKDPYEYQSPEYYEQQEMRGLEIYKSAFAGLWDSVYAKRGYGWDKNPWVFVISFERLETKGGRDMHNSYICHGKKHRKAS